jgi:hypothetical protein
MLFSTSQLNPDPDGYKKCNTVQLGVIYDSQDTNRNLGGLPVRAPLFCGTPIGRLGVIHI